MRCEDATVCQGCVVCADVPMRCEDATVCQGCVVCDCVPGVCNCVPGVCGVCRCVALGAHVVVHKVQGTFRTKLLRCYDGIQQAYDSRPLALTLTLTIPCP